MLIVNRDGTVQHRMRSTKRAQRLRQVSASVRQHTAWMKQLIDGVVALTSMRMSFPTQERHTQLPTRACVAYDHPICGW
jgi:hypothetical protein